MRRIGLTFVLTVLLSLFAGSMATASPTSYVVKSGDCLWTISNSTGVSVNTIKQINGLTSDLLQIGQVLNLSTYSVPEVVQAPVVQAPAVAAPLPAPAATDLTTYIVRPGDNLWSIAQMFGTSVESLKQLNGLTSDLLFAGDALKVGGTVSTPQVSRAGDSLTGSRVIEKAAQYLGTPYRYGGSTPSGFDCSGFTSYVFAQFQIYLNRTAAGQYSHGYWVDKSSLIPGDLVFFACGGSGISHVGIYSGYGSFIHSSSPTSGGVIYSSLTSGYYANTYVGARRIIR